MERELKKNKGFIQHHFYSSLKSGAGFTLIELLVSISIIGVLSSLVMVNTGFGTRQKNLGRAAQQLALDIRTAENLALAPSDTPNCLYGLHVQSSTQYVLYRKQICPTSGGNPALWHEYDSTSPTDFVINSVTLGNGIVISTPILPSPADLDVSFEAPEPITYLEGMQNNTNTQGTLGNTVMTITLQSSDGTTKKVVVNRFGQVEIQ